MTAGVSHSRSRTLQAMSNLARALQLWPGDALALEGMAQAYGDLGLPRARLAALQVCVGGEWSGTAEAVVTSQRCARHCLPVVPCNARGIDCRGHATTAHTTNACTRG